MFYLLDLLGTLAFAVSGALKSKSKKLNLAGVVFLGAITAVGGGTVRDLILGRTPLFYLQDINYLIISVGAGVAVFFIPWFFRRTYSFFRLTDSIGLATFTIIGVSVTLNFFFHSPPFPSLHSLIVCVFLGMLTAVGGGIIRDAILGDVPYALKEGSNYVYSAFGGAIVFYLVNFSSPLAGIIASLVLTLWLREIKSPFGVYQRVYKKHRKF